MLSMWIREGAVQRGVPEWRAAVQEVPVRSEGGRPPRRTRGHQPPAFQRLSVGRCLRPLTCLLVEVHCIHFAFSTGNVEAVTGLRKLFFPHE